jgi:hypothetical protein
MHGNRKNTLTTEIAALREEVRELRRAVERLQPRPAPPPLPGEGEVVEMMIDQAGEIAEERDEVAAELAHANRRLAKTKDSSRPGN